MLRYHDWGPAGLRLAKNGSVSVEYANDCQNMHVIRL